MPVINPIRDTNDEARALARSLMASARFGALGVIEPGTGLPQVTRISVTLAPDGQPMTLVSDLSSHTVALKAYPDCSLLLAEPVGRGDPLNQPRITLACRAAFAGRGSPDHARLRAHYLAARPKAKLYIDLADFSFAILRVRRADLNGGFGKAFRLTPADLGLDPGGCL